MSIPGFSSNITRFKDEDYKELKNKHVSRGLLFADESFKENKMNCNFLGGDVPMEIEFKRPHDIISTPILRYEGPCKALCAGNMQNLNLVIAMSVINEKKELWDNLFPDAKSQENFNEIAGYSGIFKIRFWIDGVWTEVTIDDFLPCLNGKIISPCSSRADEMWPSLLVKAYAKLLGGYACLESVRLEDALVDFTGCVMEIVSFDSLNSSTDLPSVQTFEKLTNSLAENSLTILCTKSQITSEKQCTSTTPAIGNGVDFGTPMGIFDEICSPRMRGTVDPSTGLCSSYAYLLTKTCLMPRDPSRLGFVLAAFKREGPPRDRLLRLRALLANAVNGAGFGEWIGAYSDISTEWTQLDTSDRSRIGLVLSSENEFWMPLQPLLDHFSGALICRLLKTGIFNSWQLADYHGEWHSVRSGGNLNFRETFLNNPQYTFELTKDAEEEVLISLTRKHQWDTNAKVIVHDDAAPSLGFAIFKVETNRQVRVHVLSQCKTIAVHDPKAHRAIFGRYSLERGRYLVVPFLEEPGQEASYVLRMYLPKFVDHKELILDFPHPGAFSIFTGSPVMATRLEIHQASNLAWLNPKLPPSPYCRVECEGQSVCTSYRLNTSNPVWAEKFIFFRNNPFKKPIVIEVLDRRAIGAPGFLGEHVFKSNEKGNEGTQDVDLFCKPSKKETGARMKGLLSVTLTSVGEENFMHI